MTNPITVPAPHLTEEQHIELQVQMRAFYSYTHAIILDPNRKSLGVGTGVLIQIGNHHLIATAKHVAEHNPAVMLHLPGFIDDAPPITRRILHPNRDLAIIEVKEDGSRSCCTLPMLREDNPITPADPANPAVPSTWIVGFPRYALRESQHQINFGKCNFGTYPTCIEGDYIEMRFTQGSWQYRDGNLHFDGTTNQHPGGFSGGGCWMVEQGKPGTGLLTPEKLVRLYAIQYAWNPDPENRVVQCLPIRLWVKLVYDNYADLRDLLRERFEFLCSNGN